MPQKIISIQLMVSMVPVNEDILIVCELLITRCWRHCSSIWGNGLPSEPHLAAVRKRNIHLPQVKSMFWPIQCHLMLVVSLLMHSDLVCSRFEPFQDLHCPPAALSSQHRSNQWRLQLSSQSVQSVTVGAVMATLAHLPTLLVLGIFPLTACALPLRPPPHCCLSVRRWQSGSWKWWLRWPKKSGIQAGFERRHQQIHQRSQNAGCC